jgi:FecR protein
MANMKVRTIVGLLAVLLLAAWGQAEAQLRPASAEIVRTAGRVETLPKGQSTWASATVGARLVEGDQIRALAGGSADLNLPDGSTILVAENTRFAISKLDYDAQSRERNAAFHVAVGKVRAQVSQAAVQLVRIRQSNFTISTPSGVAAVRGTITVVAYDPVTQETVVFAFPSAGESASAARVTYTTRTGQTVTVTGNNFVRQVGNNPPGRPTPFGSLPAGVQAAVQGAANQATANSQTLIVINLAIPSAAEDNSVAGTGGAGSGQGEGLGLTSDRGPADRGPARDLGGPPHTESEARGSKLCPSPPCEP